MFNVHMASGSRHSGPGSMIGLGVAFVIIFGSWIIWPRSVVAMNDWASKFRIIRAIAKTPKEGRARPTDRRIRLVSSVAFAVGVVLLVAGLVRV